MIFYAVILISTLFQGKIASYYLVKEINKILSSKYEIVEKLKNELVEKIKLKDKLMERYNCLVKSRIYLILVIASLGQLIVLLIGKDVDRIGINILMLTITISFMEFWDNRRMSKKMKNEIDREISKIIIDFIEIDEIATQDFILNDMVEKKIITEKKKQEIIKKKVRN